MNKYPVSKISIRSSFELDYSYIYCNLELFNLGLGGGRYSTNQLFSIQSIHEIVEYVKLNLNKYHDGVFSFNSRVVLKDKRSFEQRRSREILLRFFERAIPKVKGGDKWEIQLKMEPFGFRTIVDYGFEGLTGYLYNRDEEELCYKIKTINVFQGCAFEYKNEKILAFKNINIESEFEFYVEIIIEFDDEETETIYTTVSNAHQFEKRMKEYFDKTNTEVYFAKSNMIFHDEKCTYEMIKTAIYKYLNLTIGSSVAEIMVKLAVYFDVPNLEKYLEKIIVKSGIVNELVENYELVDRG